MERGLSRFVEGPCPEGPGTAGLALAVRSGSGQSQEGAVPVPVNAG